MHSADRSGSPMKRTLSRGLSEDESLLSIIKEAESSSRRLTRSDSRCGTLKRRSDSQQSDQDLHTGLPDMQASYDELVQELRGLEFEREALLFQVDILQDTLEGVEELLSEAEREAGQASMELEREREAKRKLENMICYLMQEVERLKEERNTTPAVPLNTLVGDHKREDEVMRRLKKETHREDEDSSLGAPLSNNQSSDTSTRGLPASEEVGQGEGGEDKGNPLTKLQRMITKTLGQMPSLAVDSTISKDGVHRRPCHSPMEDGRDPSPDRNNDTDSISAYEDASAETPELDSRVFPAVSAVDAMEQPDGAATTESEEGNPTSNCQANDSEPRSSRNPDLCILS